MVIIKSRAVRETGSARLSKEDWLEKSLAILAAKGPSRMRIDEIAGALGVTKGSFYHHFADHGDFVYSIVKHWDDKYNREVASKPELQRGTPQERLWHLMVAIVDYGLADFDTAIRFWAEIDSKVRSLVENGDRFRLTFVRTLFSEMGFTNTELEMRTQTFVATMSSEGAVRNQMPAAERMQLMKAQHRFFTRR
jgi:AcrR family transcriptional regulator